MSMWTLMEDLFPLRRSLTGEGVRETLRRIQREIPIQIHEVPLPLTAFDWELEHEWRFKSARLYDESGSLVIDSDNCALHCLGYSAPFRGWVNRTELESHLVVGPEEMPDAVLYCTSYYERRWGLSISWNQRQAIRGEKFLVVIDTELFRGVFNYADLVIPGEETSEIMLGSYCCHMAGLANNETSGLAVTTELVRWWMSEPRRHTLRVLFAPETLGPLVYMAREHVWMKHSPGNEVRVPMHVLLNRLVRAGFTLSCLGGPGSFALQLGRRENYASRIARHIMSHEYEAEIRPWDRRGSDERQWTAPGIDLPWATIMKTPPGDPMFPQYHTSADDLSYVRPEQLEESLALMKRILTAIEEDHPYQSKVLGEPMLSKRGLMPSLSRTGSSDGVRNLMTTWSYCDGRTVLENAEEQGRYFFRVLDEIKVLEREGIVEVVG